MRGTVLIAFVVLGIAGNSPDLTASEDAQTKPAHEPAPQRQPVDVVQEAIENDVMEAVFRHHLGSSHAADQKKASSTCYLSVRRGDPSGTFMQRFAGNSFPVKKISERKGRDDGIILFIDGVKQIDKNTYEVSAGHYFGTLNAEGDVYTVERDGKQWIIKEVARKWVS